MYCLGSDLNGLKIINLPLHSRTKPRGRFAVTKVIKCSVSILSRCTGRFSITAVTRHLAQVNQGRVGLAWQFEGTVWQERHSGSSLRQLNTTFPQTGASREGGGEEGREERKMGRQMLVLRSLHHFYSTPTMFRRIFLHQLP